MNNDKTKQPAAPSDANQIEKKKLPALESTVVEEVPASDLDDAAGGFTDCKGTCVGTSLARV